MATTDDLTVEESTELVGRMLGGAIRPTIFMLAGVDGGPPEFVAHLTVDPDVALTALQERDRG